MNNLTLSQESKFLAYFTDLINLTDSFDQLTKLALMGDLLYSPIDPVHKTLFQAMETAARNLRGLPAIGKIEVGHD